MYFMAKYTFRQKCKEKELDRLCKFIEIVTTTDWSNTDSTA
jgi:hypothetical protein